MNIPENILQQVADAAFDQSPSSPLSCVPSGTNWKRQPNIRRAVIQHAITNPALAPFLAEGGGKYTDEELLEASNKADRMRLTGFNWLRAFLAALPRRESPALAEATPPAEVAIIEEQAWVDPVCGCIRSPDAPKDSPCPICNPAAQVPLGPEDVPPGSVIRGQNWAIDWGKCWLAVLETTPTGVHCNRGDEYRFTSLHFGWQINTSIPDTGRWDKDAWRPCSKPGKEVAK